jgi:hypothetical protein
MKRLSVFVLAAALLGLAGCATYDRDYYYGRNYNDDALISQSIESRLDAEGLRYVGVETVRGTVYLEGMVPSPHARQRATTIATRTDGVDRVVNNLQIGTRSGDAPDDYWERRRREQHHRHPWYPPGH